MKGKKFNDLYINDENEKMTYLEYFYQVVTNGIFSEMRSILKEIDSTDLLRTLWMNEVLGPYAKTYIYDELMYRLSN